MYCTKKLTGVRAVAYCAICTALLAVCAQISLPFPIPFTMQTFAVFLAVCVLDIKLAEASIICYLIMGGLGLPVFSGFRGGAQAILGPTGGYMAGFLLTALISGLLLRRARGFFGRLSALLAGLAVCYFFGTAWFMAVYSKDVSLWSALLTCVIPFIGPDMIKAVLAILISDRIKKHI